MSDFNAIGELVQHGVAGDLREAARLSILAGVDIDLESGAYAKHLAQLVQDGAVPVDVVDEAVRRVLRLKMELGLFENPYVDESLAPKTMLSAEFRSLALELARQSMVLLKNEHATLPLDGRRQKVALIGPLANNRADLLGCWAITGQASDVETVLEGFKTYLADEALLFARRCAISGDERLDITAAVDAARQADVIVAVIGESTAMSGEAHSRMHLGLPGRQMELVAALKETGKPLVVVLMCGRPLAVPELAGQADAFLVAWHGGVRAGQAVADLLFGAANPSGKLTASWPRTEGQVPVYYAHKATGRPAEGSGTTQYHEPFRSTYLDGPNAPWFAFGEGLSYTRFEYNQLQVLTPSIPPDGTLQVSAVIRNTGHVAGDEIVQLYVQDLVGSVTRPVKELKGFQRISLQPGEARRVDFRVPASDLAFCGKDMQPVVEPGDFKIWVGPDSNQGLVGAFEVVAA